MNEKYFKSNSLYYSNNVQLINRAYGCYTFTQAESTGFFLNCLCESSLNIEEKFSP